MSNHHRALLAKVHIARKDLGLDEELYRDILQRVTGQRTAGGLSEHKLVELLGEFRRLGWSSHKEDDAARPKSDKPHVRKVWALWGDICRSGFARDPSRAALRSFVERMTDVKDPEWLGPEDAIKVVEALKAWKAREERKRKGAP